MVVLYTTIAPCDSEAVKLTGVVVNIRDHCPMAHEKFFRVHRKTTLLDRYYCTHSSPRFDNKELLWESSHLYHRRSFFKPC